MMVDVQRIAQAWPGKSRPAVHPALWHMLDVGAVAKELLQRQDDTAPNVAPALGLLAALHDIGKISRSFRAALTDGSGQIWYHWQHSAAILQHNNAALAKVLPGDPYLRQSLVEAAAGHHGGPRVLPLPHQLERQLCQIGPEALGDAAAVIGLIGSIFPEASLEGITSSQGQRLSWELNGLLVQADWIGSNTDWFPPQPSDVPLHDYWIKAKQRAAQAVTAAGLFGARPVSDGATKILPSAPRPMQQEALRTSLPDGPCLAIIEDMTGAGKTEAALILTARMMAAGKGAGLFFALPTMATANAMLGRLESAAPSLFNMAPTLALTHGRARHSTAFRAIQARDPGHPEHVPYCGQWLAEDRRRVLLADVGVGTIDQALLAVLPTRFNALRLRALSKHILIVDEAHSYDPYMQAQLERLLTMQARLGGSAVVLTATLPARMKHAFETAFQAGLRDRPKASRRRAAAVPIVPGPYPALTVVGNEVRLKAVKAASARSVAVVRLADPAEAVSLIVAGAAKGAACIWIRNAVDDAISAVQALADRGITADLLHARFALCDRLRHEAALQGRFGRDGTDRAGRVLVATQVAEQSLDLDFDVMVSDLAPIGSLIQRAGRMWRHMDLRPTRPVPAPILHVLSPDPAKVSERWLHGVLEKGAYVYPPVEQWRSAKVLFDTGALNTPEGLRHLIEAVHGDIAPDPPEALEGAGFAYEGEALIMRQMARNSVIDPFAPFDQEQMQKVWDDEAFPTRLGVPQRVLALARKTLDGLIPYGDDWVMSELQLSAVRVNKLVLPDQADPEIRAVKQKWSKGRAENTLIVPLADDGYICEGLRYDPDLGAIWC